MKERLRRPTNKRPYSTVQWVTFDAGGTLLFPNPSVGDIYAQVLSRHGHTIEAPFLEAWFFRAWKEDVRRCMPAVTPASERERWRGVVERTFAELAGLVNFDALFDDLWVTFRDAGSWRLPNHTEQTLSTLRRRGYRLALLSNWDDRLRPLLRSIGLEPHFEEVFISCEVGFEKPDSRIFQAVEERLEAEGNQILHIGDSHHHDVLGASSRGWHSIQAFSSEPGNPDCRNVACLSELLELLPGRAGN